MKVAFISRSTLYSDKGGDTVQVLKTAEYLQQLGVEVEIRLTNEVISYEEYDLLHFFNIIRPADILFHLRKSTRPFVVSTIFVDYSEFERHHRRGISGRLFRLLSADMIEYLKTIGRYLRSGEKIGSKGYCWMGHRKSIRKILEASCWLLPNSQNEYERLVRRYGIEKNHQVVPYGVDERLFRVAANNIKSQKMVICVGRIEGRKNQLNLIKALRNSAFQLYLIGNPARNQPNYFRACKKLSTDNIHFVPELSQQQLIPYYSEAKVHALPSWFETAGLSSLEAAAMGCNVVITKKGDAWEYFGDGAGYCDPASPESIYEAVERASREPTDFSLQQKIYSDFSWQKAALKTFEAYKEVLKLCVLQS